VPIGKSHTGLLSGPRPRPLDWASPAPFATGGVGRGAPPWEAPAGAGQALSRGRAAGGRPFRVAGGRATARGHPDALPPVGKSRRRALTLRRGRAAVRRVGGRCGPDSLGEGRLRHEDSPGLPPRVEGNILILSRGRPGGPPAARPAPRRRPPRPTGRPVRAGRGRHHPGRSRGHRQPRGRPAGAGPPPRRPGPRRQRRGRQAAGERGDGRRRRRHLRRRPGRSRRRRHLHRRHLPPGRPHRQPGGPDGGRRQPGRDRRGRRAGADLQTRRPGQPAWRPPATTPSPPSTAARRPSTRRRLCRRSSSACSRAPASTATPGASASPTTPTASGGGRPRRAPTPACCRPATSRAWVPQRAVA
jgi:hypothetical protein